MTSPVTPSTTYSANGERIYLTATSNSGSPITYQSSAGWMPGTMMMRVACATCHATTGHGGPVTMFAQSFVAPDITWPVLTGAGDMDHPPYTEETVKRAITEGIDPGGHALDPAMPRWSMTPADLDDLVSFLQTLR